MKAPSDPSLAAAYEHCMAVARAHYENFPVLSMLLPRRMQAPIAAVYAFARGADDMADEGDATPAQRLEALAEWRKLLEEALQGRAGDPVFRALADAVAQHAIPAQPLRDLLDAFEEDARQQRYETFPDLLRYCRRSADPVGRILLALFGVADRAAQAPADALCTGLQLANFWQDVSVDIARGRVFLPTGDMDLFGVSDADLRAVPTPAVVRRLLRFEITRTREYFDAARPLFGMVPWRFRLHLRAIWLGGQSMLDAIADMDCAVTERRPALSRRQMTAILRGALLPGGLRRSRHERMEGG
jgi:hydroxysqualene synthase